MTDLEIFHDAPDDATPAELAAYLDEACGDDAELRARVEGLLAMGNRTDDFLEKAAIDLDTPTLDSEGNASGKAFQSTSITSATVASEKAGDVIGPFTLIEKLGEGGFGTVWKAEQSVPIARIVALKIIKLGMDTREVLTRFEAERQALAMMSHENIAKVLDAGATENGRPYFVMELVDGVAVTKYCDERQLDTRQRLELFGDVCAAVNHAHQKGMIHRDIKPSNVMVAEQDGKPVIKVIDFGIAKATESSDAEQTMLTLQEQVIGTPAYMSPEQAGMDGLDIDTRSDIYSLGVLLYELLSGKPPFDPKTLLSAGFDEMRRIVREEEPPRPSLLVSGITEATEGETFLTTHGAGPQKLSRILRGDLDWIIMKAIEKDRARRYETANAFAADIGRFLADEPVVAAKPSVGYQVHKFARRNKVALAVASTIALVLIVATAVSSWQAVRANQEADRANREAIRAAASEKLASQRLTDSERTRQEAEQARDEAEQIADHLADIFGSPSLGRSGRTITVMEALDDSVEKLGQDQQLPLARKARLLQIISETYGSLSLSNKAADGQQKAFDAFSASLGRDHPETLTAQYKLANFLNFAKRDGSIELLADLLERRRKNGSDKRSTVLAMQRLSAMLQLNERYDEAIALAEEAVQLSREALEKDDDALIRSGYYLGLCYLKADRANDALPVIEAMQKDAVEMLGWESLLTIDATSLLADCFFSLGRLEEAREAQQNAYQAAVAKDGASWPGTLNHQSELANILFRSGDTGTALKLQREATDATVEIFGRSIRSVYELQELAGYLNRVGEYEEALKVCLEAMTQFPESAPRDHPSRILLLGLMAELKREAGQFEESLPLGEEALELSRVRLGEAHNGTLSRLASLAETLSMMGRNEEAIVLREKLVDFRRKGSAGELELAWALRNLAFSYRDAGRLSEAIEALVECVGVCRELTKPSMDFTIMAMKDLANVYEKAGNLEEAREVYSQIETWLGKGNSNSETASSSPRINLAEHPAHAAMVFQKQFDADPMGGEDSEDWLKLGVALVLSGDLAGYEEFRSRMIEIANGELALRERGMAMNSCLLTEASPEFTDRLPIALVEADLMSGEDPDAEKVDGWRFGHLALAVLRSGDPARAAALTERAETSGMAWRPNMGMARLLVIRALAEARQGESEDARATLEKAKRRLEAEGEWPNDHQRLAAELLGKETETLLRANSKASGRTEP